MQNCLFRLLQLYEKVRLFSFALSFSDFFQHGDGLADAAKDILVRRPSVAAKAPTPIGAALRSVAAPQAAPSPPSPAPSLSVPSVTSLADDVAAKEQFKYDPLLERQARAWIEAVLDESLPTESLAQVLKSGVILCRLVNEIRPGSVATINFKAIPYLQMENIQNYLHACAAMGIRATDLFNTVDLFEEKNMNQVVANLHVLGKHVRKVDGYTGPVIEDSSKARNLFAASLMNKFELLDDGPAVPYEELPRHKKQLVDWVNAELSNRDELAGVLGADEGTEEKYNIFC